MKNIKIIQDEDATEVERIIEVLKFFSKKDKAFNDWLNESQKKWNEEQIFFYKLFAAGFLKIPGLEDISFFKGKENLFDDNINKIIFVTKDGYSFLNSYKFNKQSLIINEQALRINKHVKLICIATLIVAFISLIFSLCR